MERDVQAGEEDQTERFHSVERPQLERRHHRRCLVRMEDLPEVQTMTNGKTEYTIPPAQDATNALVPGIFIVFHRSTHLSPTYYIST